MLVVCDVVESHVFDMAIYQMKLAGIKLPNITLQFHLQGKLELEISIE